MPQAPASQSAPGNRRAGRPCARSGFTLVELMVAAAVGLSLVAITMLIAFRQRSFHEAHRTTNEIRQNTSYVMQSLARDLRMAGYGLEVPSFELESWISWEAGFTENPKITEGANGGPDGVSIAGAFDRPVAELLQSVSEGGSTLNVKLLVPESFSPFDKPENRVVYLGRVETVRIIGRTGTGTNMTLQVSSEPTSLHGVRYDYPAGTTLELVKVVKYRWLSTDDGHTGYPYVNRWDTSIYSYGGLWEVSAPYIEDLQVASVDDRYQVTVTGMAAVPDIHYTHPTRGDGYRRWTLSASVTPRN